MRRMRIGWVLVLAASIAAPAVGADLSSVLKQAEKLLDEQKFSESVTILERVLPDARGDARVLQLLRRAYRGEVQRLVADGERAEAQKYLDRLQLIERAPDTLRTARPAVYGTDEQVKVIVPEAASFTKVASHEPTWRPAKKPIVVETADAKHSPAASDGPKDSTPAAKVLSVRATKGTPAAVQSGDPAKARDCIKRADALFLARRYLEAGEWYERANRLTAESTSDRTDRRAYCQLARVVEQINGQPESGVVWPKVASDVRAILELVPQNEFAQSLLAMAERNTDARRVASRPTDPVIRASEPEQTDVKEPNLLAGLAARIGLACSENSGKRSRWQRFRSGQWQVLETSNFRVHATDDNLAGQVADVAECTRIELYRTWYGAVPESNWTPKCDIYVHDSAEQYGRVTKQGPGSPGHSQTGVDRGRITSRRIDLRRDGPDLTHAILPHEITHVVLADRFNAKPMPRWADEGMAVLTEPTEKKQAHLRNLGDISQLGRLFTARQLMTMGDYPPGNQWPMFYAESVSLVEFLVNRGGPAKFVEFMERSLANGYEGELKHVYGFDSFDSLDREWSRGRTEQVTAATESSVRR
jgi:tetratricopeptide (TPR) repeat protein